MTTVGLLQAEIAMIKALILSESLLARVRKKLDLCQFLYQQLRRVDGDDPTMGIMYQMWLETEDKAREWHKDRFAVGDAEGFRKAGPDAVTLCALGSSEASGRDVDHPWTAEEIVAFRWNKMDTAGSGMGGRLTALAHVVNPAFHADASVRDVTVLKDACDVVKHRLGASMAMKIWGQLQEHLDTSKTSELFVDAGTGQRHRACNYEHEEARGLEGRDFWYKLPPPNCFEWAELRVESMMVLSATATETAAERHYSQLDATQHEKRASLDPGKAGRLTFIKSEIHQGVADRSSNYLSMEDLEAFDAIDGLTPPAPPPPPPPTPEQAE